MMTVKIISYRGADIQSLISKRWADFERQGF